MKGERGASAFFRGVSRPSETVDSFCCYNYMYVLVFFVARSVNPPRCFSRCVLIVYVMRTVVRVIDHQIARPWNPKDNNSCFIAKRINPLSSGGLED